MQETANQNVLNSIGYDGTSAAGTKLLSPVRKRWVTDFKK
jgi:hypothetical protein